MFQPVYVLKYIKELKYSKLNKYTKWVRHSMENKIIINDHKYSRSVPITSSQIFHLKLYLYPTYTV